MRSVLPPLARGAAKLRCRAVLGARAARPPVRWRLAPPLGHRACAIRARPTPCYSTYVTFERANEMLPDKQVKHTQVTKLN